jgi:hypothetical protein
VVAHRLHLRRRTKERALLERMTELAESSRHLPDARIKELAKWIRANCFENGKWTNRRVLIFTEWEDTLRYLQTQIKRIVADADPDEERVKIYRGFTKKQDRESLRDAFNAPPEDSIGSTFCFGSHISSAF